MKILIQSPGSADITIPVPNFLLFSPTLLDLLMKAGVIQSEHPMPNLSKETVRAICAALQTHSKSHGPWTLVQVESAGGAKVTIII